MNANGVINAQDVTLTRNRQFTALPESEPPPLPASLFARLSPLRRDEEQRLAQQVLKR